jgi:hypothetical protein
MLAADHPVPDALRGNSMMMAMWKENTPNSVPIIELTIIRMAVETGMWPCIEA